MYFWEKKPTHPADPMVIRYNNEVMDSEEIEYTWKSCNSPVRKLIVIKKNPPTNNIIPVETRTLTGRITLDEYSDPTDQLSAAIINANMPTNSNILPGESNSRSCAAKEGRKNKHCKSNGTHNNSKYS